MPAPGPSLAVMTRETSTGWASRLRRLLGTDALSAGRVVPELRDYPTRRR
jgi:hypothetical protein